MSGSTNLGAQALTGGGDVTRIVLALQASVQATYALQQTLASGLTVNTTLPTYTVATLPASAAIGRMAFATNGRANTSQGSGAGTGAVVVWNGTAWTAIWSGVQVVA